MIVMCWVVSTRSEDEDLLTVAEAARRFEIPESTLRRWIGVGKLTPVVDVVLSRGPRRGRQPRMIVAAADVEAICRRLRPDPIDTLAALRDRVASIERRVEKLHVPTGAPVAGSTASAENEIASLREQNARLVDRVAAYRAAFEASLGARRALLDELEQLHALGGFGADMSMVTDLPGH